MELNIVNPFKKNDSPMDQPDMMDIASMTEAVGVNNDGSLFPAVRVELVNPTTGGNYVYGVPIRTGDLGSIGPSTFSMLENGEI